MVTTLPTDTDVAAVAAGAAAFAALRDHMLADGGYRWASSYRGVHTFEKVTAGRIAAREAIIKGGVYVEVTR